MDVGNQNHWDLAQVVPSGEILKIISAQYPLVHIQGTHGGDTSETYRYQDGRGEVGFISSVTKAFCGTCNRLRLSADGKIYTCLFATHGMDLGKHLRNGASDELLADLIRVNWMKREDRYSETRQSFRHQSTTSPKIEMYQIGG